MRKEPVACRGCGLRHQMKSAYLPFHTSKMLYLYISYIYGGNFSVLTWNLQTSMHKYVLGSFSKLTTFPRNADSLVLYRYLLMLPRNSLRFFQTEEVRLTWMPSICTERFGENCDLTMVPNISSYIYGDQKKSHGVLFLKRTLFLLMEHDSRFY